MSEAVNCLVEIVQTTMQRMEAGGVDIQPAEALTLGMIVGIALRVPEVVETLNTTIEEKVNVHQI